jgi:hypothetical protein
MHFSNLTFEAGASFLEKDRDYFIRSLTIATNVTYSAMTLGYYDLEFLKALFTNTITSFEKVLDGRSPISLKEKLENYRKSKVTMEEMKEVIKLNRENVMFEKSSGNGINSIVPSEMSELELLMVELNESYTYESNEDSNYFKRVTLRNINIQEKFCKVIESSLGITEDERNAA